MPKYAIEVVDNSTRRVVVEAPDEESAQVYVEGLPADALSATGVLLNAYWTAEVSYLAATDDEVPDFVVEEKEEEEKV